jgi:hypothetical protein
MVDVFMLRTAEEVERRLPLLPCSEPLSTRALAHAKNPAKTRAFKMVEFIKRGWMPRNKKASSMWSSVFS